MAPEAVVKAGLQVLYVAAYTTRNWTLSEEVERKQVNDLWEALHNVPVVLKNWRGDKESLAELKMYFEEYWLKWERPDLKGIFNDALEDSKYHL